MTWLRELKVGNTVIFLTLNKLRLPFQVQAYRPPLATIDSMTKITFAIDELKVGDEIVMYLLNSELHFDYEDSDDSSYQMICRQSSSNQYIGAVAAVPNPMRQASRIQRPNGGQGLVLDLLTALQPQDDLCFGILTEEAEDDDDDAEEVWDDMAEAGNPAVWDDTTFLPSEIRTVPWPENGEITIDDTDLDASSLGTPTLPIRKVNSVVKRGDSLSLYGKTGVPHVRYFEWQSWKHHKGDGPKY